MDEDTELLLVLLESSLSSSLHLSKAELLEALIASGGSIENAARSLTHSASQARPSSKRKAGTGLDGWIKSSKQRILDEATSERELHNAEPPSKRVIDSVAIAGPSRLHNSFEPEPVSESNPAPPPLLRFLQDRAPQKSAVRPHPPVLLLATPETIAKHTPTTLRPSILPPG